MPKYDLVDTGTQTLRMRVPQAPIFTVDLGFSSSLAVELTLDTDNIRSGSVTAAAKVEGDVTLSVGVGVSFTVCGVGVSLAGGGIEGAVELEGNASITFTATTTSISAAMAPATLKLDMAAYIYFDFPDIDLPGPYNIDGEEVAEEIAELHSSLSSRGSRIRYEVGRVNIFQATTPAYRGSFNVGNGRFSGISRAGGRWSFRLSRPAQNAFNTIKIKLEQAINAYIPDCIFGYVRI